MITRMIRVWFDRSGVSAIEYALLAAIVGAAIIGGATLIGADIEGVFEHSESTISSTSPK